MALNQIDFSEGIRPEEIQENFQMLQDQINRERLSVGGLGIASGFDIETIITDTQFAIKLSAASIIDNEGEELFIPACTVDIDKPELFDAREYHVADKNNQIKLNNTPYAITRNGPSQYQKSFEPEISGIYINYRNNNKSVDDYIRVSNIENNTLSLTGLYKKDIVVQYKYTANRLDTIYLNKNNEVSVLKGTTSTTPSQAYMPNDGKMIIAYLMVECSYVDEYDATPHAYMYIRDDMRTLRNLYTDKDNNLYICGVPFDDLQIIHLKEPKNPSENTIWLNTETNTLSYWKSTDEFVYYNKIIVDTDFVENYNANRDFATYMDFLLNENELHVYLNGKILYKDKDYYELHNNLPTVEQNIAANTEGNSFRILETKENGIKLKPGDEIMYMIRYKDSHFMWVPINKMSYINAKDSKVYCTGEYTEDGEDYFKSEAAESMGYMPAVNYDSGGDIIDGIDTYKNKYKYFLFHREKDMNLLFTPGKKELTLLINQMLLHEDQYKEITVYDLLGENPDLLIPDEVKSTAAIYYGWTKDALEQQGYKDIKAKTINDFDCTGVGFMLVDPLDSGWNAENHSYAQVDGSNDIYVEAIVERRICNSPIVRKFQRSATFVDENTIAINEDMDSLIVELEDSYYRYDEHQLEVFINGRKLNTYSKNNRQPELIEEFGYYLEKIVEKDASDESIEHILEEEVLVKPIDGSEDKRKLDQNYFIRKKAAICKKFKINKKLFAGDRVTYKITTNIYSYDHINNILDELYARLDSDFDTMEAIYNNLVKVREEIDKKILDVETKVLELSADIDGNNFITRDEIIDEKHIDADLVSRTVCDLKHINFYFEFEVGVSEYPMYSLQTSDDPSSKMERDVRPEDYITVIRRQGDSQLDSFLMRDVDYSIVNVFDGNTYLGTKLCLLKDDYEYWNTGDIFIVTGIKFGRVGR